MKCLALTALAGVTLVAAARAASPDAAGTVLGVTAYVRAYCPEYRTNNPAARELYARMGYVGGEELPFDVLLKAAETVKNFEQDPPLRSCAFAWKHFGAGGSFPDILLRN